MAQMIGRRLLVGKETRERKSRHETRRQGRADQRGARGMGAAEARLFAREGARVVIGDILEAEGRAVEADIKTKGGEAVFVRLDVTREADWQAAVGQAVRRFGKLDVLVDNPGRGRGTRL